MSGQGRGKNVPGGGAGYKSNAPEGGRGRGGGGRGRGGRAFGRKPRLNKIKRGEEEELEAKLGFDLFTEGEPRLGWLLTMASSSFEDEDDNKTFSCVDLYFVCQDGSTFKSKYKFAPYFYVATKEKTELDVEAYLRRRYEGHISDIEVVDKEDLDLKNHLSGSYKTYLKVSFDTVQDLMHVKSDLLPVVERNQAKLEATDAYESFFIGKSDKQKIQDFLDCIIDMREYDVPYHVRFAIDNDARCGQWYTVKVDSAKVTLERRADLLQRAEVHVCAFDIETTKLPLKFPDAEYDMVMMISYMVDGEGYLIINRECVGEDIEDLEYTPKPEFEGIFKVTNVPNERELIKRWFDHMHEVKPGIYVTYNGDFFDWPFLEQRANHYGMRMSDEIGFRCDKIQGECRAKFACHLDCFAWVKRDSYLPQGSQGLKAVTKAKLGYDPLEVNPEDMVRFAMEEPQTMASYSVSDAVATYYLYMTYVHPFIFSLATIIPMPPDEVLRKGSGTLCEMLLMVQAFKANIICPNKHQSEPEKFYNGHLLESETYIGGHVECLESGVFRSDLPTKFRLEPSAYQQLLDNLDRDLQYAIKVEGKMDLDSVINYDDVKNDIMQQLEALRDVPNREERPLIYHLDVAAMYPNIILTNRLQPPSIVTDDVCAACDFNRPGKTCLRHLEWVWRGETYTAKRSEYYHLKNQIESEQVATGEGQLSCFFRDLPKEEQETRLKDRLKKYCQKVYKRVIDKPVTERRVAGICMRENPFYADTVRSFRDRRYEYKGLNKVWKGKFGEAKASGNPVKIQEAQDMVVLYDSLQLAHKCILNSFYGYVMRKGARWYSMEMAGVVTYTGAKIIQNARLLVEKIGKPLELDTDGIWCALPGSFPENFSFKTSDPKKKLTISYPCVMLNVDVARNNTNDQYQTLDNAIRRTYTTRSECSIEFEVDGPYKAMILPASKEEGVLIKKRYAVFNDDGTLAELKGFEIKRRGELKLIKVFQDIFQLLHLYKGNKTSMTILHKISGLVKLGRLTLLLGPPASGKTTLSWALTRKLDKSFRVDGSVTFNGHNMDEFVPQRTSTYIGQHDMHNGDMTVRETLDFSTRFQGVRSRYDILTELSRREKEEGIKPDPDIDVFVKAEVFDRFLHGTTLEECYAAVASVADRWLDLLDNQGVDVSDGELLDFISESSTMSKSLLDYGEQKSCAVTTARRLADFLGDAMVKDKGLMCRYIVARDPQGAPVSERAIPVAIFETEPEIRKVYIRKWCKTSCDVGIRSIVDWSYYRQRLSSAIQKIITIPAAMQKIANPVPRVAHPDWLHKKVRDKDDKFRQRNIRDMFGLKNKSLNQTPTSNHCKDIELVGDLEDMANKENMPHLGPRPVVRNFESKKGSSRNKNCSQEPENIQKHRKVLSDVNKSDQRHESIDKNVDYQGWLDQKKRKWKETLEKRKKLRVDDSLRDTDNMIGTFDKLPTSRGNIIERTRGGVGAFFRSREAALTHSHWQILQLFASQKPGEFFAWVMAGGNLFKIPIKAPRVFYINTKAPITEEFPGKRVTRILPHGRTSFNLIEVVVDEEQFKAAGRKLAAHLADPEVEGVYETKMPLDFSTVLQLGCVCKVDINASNRNPRDGWNLSELHMKTTTECHYMQDQVAFFYLYQSTSEGRGLYALYTPASSTVSVVVVNPFQNRELSFGQLEKQFRDCLRNNGMSKGDTSFDSIPSIFKVEYVGTTADAGKLLQRILNDYRDQHRGPTLSVIECPSMELLSTTIPVITEFPCVNVPCNARDSQYQALGWQTMAARTGMQRCAASSQWLNERIALARYAHVPIGNFNLDWLMFTADVFYSRALHDHQHVLWISDDGVPDLGGIAEEEPSFADEVQQPVLIYPGAYRTVSVELKIHHLAVNALLKSSQVNEMEGGALLGFELDGSGGGGQLGNETLSWDEATLCAPAFRVLKQMVQGCVADAVSSGNIFADALLQHLYRWLCSPQSKLHDPALHRVLQKVMQKVFALLLAEFRKLGATIIYADFSRIIVDTGKGDLVGAQGYCEYLLKTLQSRELFEWIEMEPQRFWHSLLFMDQYNYGGIQAKLSAGTSTDSVIENESQPDIVSSWNIAEYLPKAIQDYFVVIVSEFIYLPWKHSQEQAALRAAARDGSFCTPSVTIAAAADVESEEVSFLKEQIASYFTDKLLRIVRDTQRHITAKGRREDATVEAISHEFPKLAGSYLPMGDSALEFIKHVSAVLALDHHVQHDVLVMRKNLLKLVHVKEFSPEAEFRDPCLSFTLPNVICSYCNDCRDLDLCRDAALLEHDWRCSVPQCGQPYNKEWIENALIQIIRQRERLYHVQDLVCSKCHQIKSSHLADQCSCAGSFLCTDDPVGFLSKMQVFLNIAVFHQFSLLKECASWIVEAN